MAKTVDDYLRAHAHWSPVLDPLCGILRDSELEETVKWDSPVYTLAGRNVIGLGAFKSYAGLWFFDGALLDDPDQVLINAQQGKTRGMRQWRFQRDAVIDKSQVQAYVAAAIDNAKAGKQIKARARKPVEMPTMLSQALARDSDLAAAFAKFTPGRQREFAEFIGEAKQAATREKRLLKSIPMIARGEGLNDRYRK